jgi:hypothetical protein
MKVKKILVVLLVLMMVSNVFGCSKPAENTTATTAPQTSEKENPTTVENTQETEAQSEKSLEGNELLRSITYEMPKSFVMETRVTIDGMTSTMITYSKGDSQRMESESYDGIKGITVYNAEEGITYMYNEGDLFGFMSDDDIYEDEDSEAEDWEGSTLEELLGDQQVFDAKEVTIDGNKAIYIEMQDNYDGIKHISRFWYAYEYPILYKYEIEENGKIIMTGETIRFEVNVPLEDALFEKPKDIEFQDMYGGFGGFEGMTDFNFEEEKQE